MFNRLAHYIATTLIYIATRTIWRQYSVLDALYDDNTLLRNFNFSKNITLQIFCNNIQEFKNLITIIVVGHHLLLQFLVDFYR